MAVLVKLTGSTEIAGIITSDVIQVARISTMFLVQYLETILGPWYGYLVSLHILLS